MIKGLVSVVIPTCERGKKAMDDCLLSIALSSYKNIEIIGIDEGKERSAQRNIGLRQAKGEYVLYLDDDQYISSDLINECVNLMHLYDAVYIPEIIVTDNWFGRLRNWERQFYTGTSVDCIRFFKAKDISFDESMSGPEDADFDHRYKGHRAISKNVLYHDDNIGIVQYLKKKAYYARSMEVYKRRWPQDKVLNWYYRCIGIFIEGGKWKRLVKRPDYSLALMVLIFLRAWIYLCRKRS
jgi:glycosyltransferase involved in cell wall biosynthesis